MITTLGKNHIRRYLAASTPNLAGAIAVGVGEAAEALGQTALGLEFHRVEILYSFYDFANNNIVFKAELPDDLAGKIYEIGLFSKLENASSGTYGSKLLISFDSDSENWYNGINLSTFTSVNTRVGKDSLSHTPAASGTNTSSYAGLAKDFSANSSADTFNFAFYNTNTNVSNISFRFKTDAANYFTHTVSNPPAGYQIVTATKGSFVATGAPSWSNIDTVEVATSSKASGASNVEFDAIRLEDVDDVDIDYVLISRKKLVTPITKLEGQMMDIEFTLGVSV